MTGHDKKRDVKIFEGGQLLTNKRGEKSSTFFEREVCKEPRAKKGRSGFASDALENNEWFTN